MSPSLHHLHVPGAVLQRGFWLYVWEVTVADGGTVLYVGRTGDSSSPNAQSPFSRLSQHLGTNHRSNALRRHLVMGDVDPISCSSFELVTFGPILPQAESIEDHRERRDTVAGMEKALCDALHAAGYKVLNEVHCRQKLDLAQWQMAFNAFAERFPRLKSQNDNSEHKK